MRANNLDWQKFDKRNTSTPPEAVIKNDAHDAKIICHELVLKLIWLLIVHLLPLVEFIFADDSQELVGLNLLRPLFSFEARRLFDLLLNDLGQRDDGLVS